MQKKKKDTSKIVSTINEDSMLRGKNHSNRFHNKHDISSVKKYQYYAYWRWFWSVWGHIIWHHIITVCIVNSRIVVHIFLYVCGMRMYCVHCICRTREPTWKVFVADGQSRVYWSRTREKNTWRDGVFQTRKIELWKFRRKKEKKKARGSCLHISETCSNTGNCAYVYTLYKYCVYVFYTRILLCVEQLLAKPCFAYTHSACRTFSRGSFELFPKAIRHECVCMYFFLHW